MVTHFADTTESAQVDGSGCKTRPCPQLHRDGQGKRFHGMGVAVGAGGSAGLGVGDGVAVARGVAVVRGVAVAAAVVPVSWSAVAVLFALGAPDEAVAHALTRDPRQIESTAKRSSVLMGASLRMPTTRKATIIEQGASVVIKNVGPRPASGSGLGPSHAKIWKMLQPHWPNSEFHQYSGFTLQSRFETACREPRFRRALYG